VRQESGGFELNKSLRYRSEIDGLRAIAVLIVVFYHFNIFHLLTKGGFVGVDVFFVISGYLITQVILSDHESQFWIRKFYFRRIRRIFPALILILLASLIVSALIMLQYEFKIFGFEIVGGGSFTSNFVYLRESGYFDSSAVRKPLLHLWSLGIEEQFYLFWPVLIWLFSKLKINFRLVIGAITLISFIYCHLISSVSQNLAFYSPFSRTWELGAGAFLASLTFSKENDFFGKLAALGLPLLLLSFILIDSEKNWPGFWTCLPVLATVLILSDHSPHSLQNRLLSYRVLTWLGKISYPLYLWHWPILVFFGFAIPVSPNKTVKLTLFFLCLILAHLTYNFVERPVRNQKKLDKWVIPLFVSMTFITSIGIIIANSNGFPSRISSATSLENSLEISAQLNPVEFQDKRCLEMFPNPKSADYDWWFCRSNLDAPPSILLWGNSFANQYFEGMAQSTGFKKTSLLSIGDCAIEREPNLAHGTPCTGKSWQEQRDFIENLIRNTPSLKFVILAGLKDDANLADLSDLRDALHFLKSQKVRSIVFYPHLKPKKSIYACINRPIIHASWNCKVPISFRQDAVVKFASSVKMVEEEFPSTLIFDPNDSFCNEKECNFTNLGVPLLRDTAPHMSIAGSRLVAENFSRWFKLHLDS